MTRLAVALLLLLTGCMEIDVFQPVEADAYDLPGNVVPAALLEEIELPSTDGVLLAAIWAWQADAVAAPTAIYLHGQAENVDGAWGRVQAIWRAGFNVLVVDYRGFGRSSGSPSESGVYADAAAALAIAQADARVDVARIVVWGFSLGTGVASWLATWSGTAALVLEAPYTSMWELIEESSPYGIPGRWATDAELDTIGRIDRIGAPLVVAYGTEDRRVPNWMSRRVHERAHLPKRLVVVEGSSHERVGPEGIAEIAAALADIAPAVAP